jgi:hypothetical protein
MCIGFSERLEEERELELGWRGCVIGDSLSNLHECSYTAILYSMRWMHFDANSTLKCSLSKEP